MDREIITDESFDEDASDFAETFVRFMTKLSTRINKPTLKEGETNEEFLKRMNPTFFPEDEG